MRWWDPRIEGRAPRPRKTHSTGLVGNRLFIFGGHNGESWLSDLHILDLTPILEAYQPKLCIKLPATRMVQDILRLIPAELRESMGSRLLPSSEAVNLAQQRPLGIFSPSAKSAIGIVHANRDSVSPRPISSSQSVPLVCDTSAPRGGAAASSRRPPEAASPAFSGALTHRSSDGAGVPADSGLSPLPANATTPQRLTRSSSGQPLADVLIEVQGKRYPLHRALLAARCSYFRAMFTCGMRETLATSSSAKRERAHDATRRPEVAMHLQDCDQAPSILSDSDRRPLSARATTPKASTGPLNVIKLADVQSDVFAVLVCYLYTDTLPAPLPDSMIVPLLQQAQKLGIERLSLLCQRALESKLDVSNVSTTLECSDVHGAEPLRQACMKFILEHFDAVSKTPGFLSMDDEVMREVMYRRAYPAQSPLSVKRYLEKMRRAAQQQSPLVSSAQEDAGSPTTPDSGSPRRAGHGGDEDSQSAAVSVSTEPSKHSARTSGLTLARSMTGYKRYWSDAQDGDAEQSAFGRAQRRRTDTADDE